MAQKVNFAENPNLLFQQKHLLESSDDELYSDLGPIVDVSEACIVTYAVTGMSTSLYLL